MTSSLNKEFIFRYLILTVIYSILLVLGLTMPSSFLFMGQILFLCIYLLSEIIMLRAEHPQKWALSPVVLASIFTFILSFGISNIPYFIPSSTNLKYLYNILGPDAFDYMNKTMSLTILAAFSMWFGYRSKIGDRLFSLLTNNKILNNNFFKKSFQVKNNVVIILFICSIAARLISIQLGIYGYSQSEENREEFGAVMNILYMLGSLGSFSLLVFSITYYSQNKFKIFLIAAIIIEIIFGLLSGMKSQVVMPFIIVLFTYYLFKRKLNKPILALVILSIFAAYYIIEPFRILRNLDERFESTPSYIVKTLSDSYEINKRSKLVESRNVDEILFQFIGRMEYTLITARAIQYKDQIGLSSRDPDFRERLLTIPLQAFIPRALWSGKGIENTGQWYSLKVWGSTANTSVAYSPIGYLYFAGGYLFIFIFFGLFGSMQKILFKFLEFGGGGILIYAGLITSIVLIPSTVNTIFVGWLRTLPVLFLLQAWIYKK